MLQMCWNTWKELYQETYPKWETVAENLLLSLWNILWLESEEHLLEWRVQLVVVRSTPAAST